MLMLKPCSRLVVENLPSDAGRPSGRSLFLGVIVKRTGRQVKLTLRGWG